MTSHFPAVRIIVLNYNGAGRIEHCLHHLQATNYPALRITVVDNASTDGSVAEVARLFPDVELVENAANIGFSRGNNRALRSAEEPYLGLLNPDTQVDPNWLRPLVAHLNTDPLVGGVGPKILHLHDRLPLQITSPEYSPPDPDTRRLGLRLYGAQTSAGTADITAGAYGMELDHDGQPFRWTSPKVKLAIPVADASLDVDLQLNIAAPASRPKVPVTVQIGSRTIGEAHLTEERATIRFRVESETSKRLARPAIESAGIAPLPDGSMRDRGTRLLEGTPWSDWDGPDYDVPREIFAPKGAAVLYRRDMLETLDYLDSGIFMYYEDADLAWRARRRGWRFWYEPAGVVRHEHAALSHEWSPTFVRNVEFGKLRMLAKNAPRLWGLQHTAAIIQSALDDSRRSITLRDAQAGRLALARLRALRDTFLASPYTFQLRNTEARLAPLDGREIDAFIESP